MTIIKLAGKPEDYAHLFAYDDDAGYKITTEEGEVFTCCGWGIHTTMGNIIEHHGDIVSVEKFCDNYRDYILKVARGEV